MCYDGKHRNLHYSEQISKKRKNFHYSENSAQRPKGGAEQRSLVEAAELDIIALSACQKSKREVHLIDKVALRVARLDIMTKTTTSKLGIELIR